MEWQVWTAGNNGDDVMLEMHDTFDNAWNAAVWQARNLNLGDALHVVNTGNGRVHVVTWETWLFN